MSIKNKNVQLDEIPEFISCEGRDLPEPEVLVPTGVWHVTIRDELDYAEEFYESQFDAVVNLLIEERSAWYDERARLNKEIKAYERRINSGFYQRTKNALGRYIGL